MNGGEVVFTFKGDAKQLTSVATNVGNIIKGSIASKAIAKGFQAITSSVDSAVRRLDTMNAFPKLMQNFGVTADEASESIKRIDKSVSGLPTPLNQAVASVQDLFMVTNDLPKAEKMFQAVNDSAMVFANGSTEASQRFIYAYKQALSAGKVSAQDFNQMNEAIPGVMTKVAESMGITFADLKEGLSKGNISMDEFNKALIKLDTEGGAGLDALHQAAYTATGGIQTSFANMKTAITRGVANMIDTIDNKLKSLNLGGISGVIQSITQIINSAFKSVNAVISGMKFDNLSSLIPVLTSVFAVLKNGSTIMQGFSAAGGIVENMVSSLAPKLAGFAPMVIKGIGISVILGAIVAGLGTIQSTAGSQINTMLTNVANDGPKFITNFVNGITSAMPQLIEQGAILVNNLLNAINANLPALITGGIGVITSLINGIANSLPTLIPTVIQIILTIVNTLIQNLPTIVTAGLQLLVGIITGLTNALPQLISYLPTIISTIVSTLTRPDMISKILSAGLQLIIALVRGIIQSIPQLIMAIPQIVSGLVGALKSNMTPEKFLSFGKNVMNGILNGLSAKMGELKNKIKSIGDSIKNGLSKVLKIGSPSKVTYQIGKYTDQGMINGLDSLQPEIQDSLQNMVDLSPSLYGTATNNLSPNVNVQVYNSMQTDPLGQVVNNIKTYSGGSKNDFNYGMGY